MSKREFSFLDVRPSRAAKKTVSFCDTSNLELEFDEDGYKRSKTKSFKKKANATNSNSDEFELGPKADTSDSKEFDMGPKADTVLSEIESEDEEMIGLKRKKNSNVQTQTHKYTGHPIAVVIDEEDEEATKPSTAPSHPPRPCHPLQLSHPLAWTNESLQPSHTPLVWLLN
jgi:hypothetical protein